LIDLSISFHVAYLGHVVAMAEGVFDFFVGRQEIFIKSKL
jgi:hypothetical protein